MAIVSGSAGIFVVPGPQAQRPKFELYDKPTISGDLREGGVVKAESATFAGPAFQVSYTFTLMSGGISVAETLSADGSYTIPAASAGNELRVRQYATDEAGQRIYYYPNGVLSDPYIVLAAGAPAFTAPPTLSVERAEGQTVTASPGTITGTPVPTVTYQWFLDDMPVAGQTQAGWVIPTGSKGKTFWCDVTATNQHGAVTVSTEVATVTSDIAFPAAIADNLWTVTEITDETEAAGVSGKRKLVLGATTVPAEFELRWASQGQPVPQITQYLPVVAPSATSINDFSLAVGTENGNALYWRHVPSDPTLGGNLNAWQQATPVRIIEIQGIALSTPPASGASAWVGMPLYTDADAAAGLPAGDGGQVMLGMHRNQMDPDRLYVCQDVGAVRVSIDGGFQWNTLENFGLGTNFSLSVRSDLRNPNRVLALQGHRYDPANNGIYISENGGISWAEAFSYPFSLGESRTGNFRISQVRDAPDRWYCVLDTAAGFKTTLNNASSPALLTSDQGGAVGTWSKVRDLPAGTFGDLIWGCESDPTQGRSLYAWGRNGLMRFEDAPNPTGAVTTFAGLPAGEVRRLNISADGQTLTLVVKGSGVWRSTNAGSTWARIFADTAISHVAVNPGFPQSMWAWEKGATNVKYSSDGGATFSPCSIKTETGGNAGVRNEPEIIPDPRAAGSAFLFGSAYFYNTTNGLNFVRTQDGFLGYHHKNYSGDHMFTGDPLRFAFAALDVGAMFTVNGGETFETVAPYGGQKSGNGLAFHQDNSTVLNVIGAETKGSLWKCVNFFDPATRKWTQVRSVEDKGRQWVGFGRGTLDIDMAWQMNERSTNKGDTWAAMPNMPANSFIVGVSRAVIGPAGSTRSILYAADIDNAGTKQRVYRSIDGGDTWPLAFDAGYSLRVGTDFYIPFRVHPTDPYIVFTRGPSIGGNVQIRSWNTSTSATRDYDVFNGVTPPFSNYTIDIFTTWAANPQIMYARAKDHGGTQYYLRGTEDGGTTWTDMGEGIPTVTEGRGFEVHPVTGALYYGSANGMFTRNSTGATADATKTRINTRFPGRRAIHFGDPYGPAYTSAPVAPPPTTNTLGAPSSAAISAALSTPLRRHDESGNGTPGWGGAMGNDFLTLCIAARAGNTSVDSRIKAYLDNIFAPGSGRDPLCTGHYPSQMDLRTLFGCTALRYTPRYWDNGILTAAMKRRIGKSVDASAHANLWNIMDNQPGGSGDRTMRGLVKNTRTTGSNIQLGPIGCIINAICFLGSASALETKMKAYDHTAFRDSLIADGDNLQNAYKSFNSRNRALTEGSDGALASVPTDSEMNAAIRGAWRYLGYPITDIYGLLGVKAGSQVFAKALSPKIMWGKNDGVGTYLAGTKTASGWGYMIGTSAERNALPGLNTAESDFFEWDNNDSKGERSSGQYASYTAASVLGLIVVLVASGLHEPGNAAWMSILRRVDRAMASFNYKANQGYRSWAHNSSGGIHAGLWGKGQTETNSAVTGGWGGNVPSYQAWGLEYAKSLWVDCLRPVLL